MPEMKRNFTKGKMNKDLDERLVPNGEYRDAMNVQVSTSDDSEVGALQNILGNIEGCHYTGQGGNIDPIPLNAFTVGSVSDEKNDTFYWLVSGQDVNYTSRGSDLDYGSIDLAPLDLSLKDMIMRKTPQGCEPVFVDKFAFTLFNASDEDVTKISGIPQDVIDTLETGWTVSGVHHVTGLHTDDILITKISGKEKTPFHYQYRLAPSPGDPVPGDDTFTLGPAVFLIFASLLHELNLFEAALPFLAKLLGTTPIDPTLAMSPPISTSSGKIEFTKKLIINKDNGNFIPPHWQVGDEIHFLADGTAPALSGVIGVIEDSAFPNYIIVHNADGDEIVPFGHGYTGEVIHGPLNTIYFDDVLPLASGNYTRLFFKGPRTLNFNHEEYVTGLNIIDDMLFWTDNKTEPKKINIPRSIEGTYFTGNKHTFLINKAQNFGKDITIGENRVAVREKHITVIKTPPKNTLALDLDTGIDSTVNTAGIMTTGRGVDADESTIRGSSSSTVKTDKNFGALQVGDTVRFNIKTDLDSNDEFSVAWDVGDILVLKEFNTDAAGAQTTQPQVPLAEWSIRGVIEDWKNTNFITEDGASPVRVELKILNINGEIAVPLEDNTLDYVVDIERDIETIFELKFPRFSYRYKYEDGEYSTFAPWSQVAFTPGGFRYEPKEGWNTGMVNSVVKIVLKNFVTQDIPEDVVSIDILYKEEISPNIYIVETISPIDSAIGKDVENFWNSNEYTITSETVKATLASNQLLRTWDNVPRMAQAQEISGNRIIYANYVQGHDLQEKNLAKYKPDFKNSLDTWGDTNPLTPQKSIKSLREYKLGVVFTDKYGRETPILTSETGGFKVNKKDAVNYNRLKVGLSGDAPLNMVYFKFYIKETSTEYYNVPMDRWYDAEDGNIWLAFPSSDRNKIDLDTALFLKKGSEGSSNNEEKYKVLAIENEAPRYIKTRQIRIGSVTHDSKRKLDPSTTGATEKASVFGGETTAFGVSNLVNAPKVTRNSFHLNYPNGEFAQTSISHLEEITEDLYITFRLDGVRSSDYKISQITKAFENDLDPTNPRQHPVKYNITLDESLKDDIDFIFDTGNSETASKILDDVKIDFTKEVVENSPRFEGRFFVKIANDGKIKVSIAEALDLVQWDEDMARKVYVLNPDTGGQVSGEIDKLQTVSTQAWIEDNCPVYPNKDPNHSDPTKTTTRNPITEDYNDPPSNTHNWPVYAHNANIFQVGSPAADTTSSLEIQENFRALAARKCYFGYHDGNFSNRISDDNKANRTFTDSKFKGNLTAHGRAMQYDTGVWFVNRAITKYKVKPEFENLHGEDLVWKKNPKSDEDDDDWSKAEILGGGLTHSSGRSNLDLAYGGIGYNNAVDDEDGLFNMTRLHHGGSGRFEINAEGNRMSDFWIKFQEQELNFQNSISPGVYFKWREDPTGQIYYISSQVGLQKRQRFERYDAAYGYQLFDGAIYTTDRMNNTWRRQNERQSRAHLNDPSSYIKNYNFNIEPSIVGKWNPIGDGAGTIAGGNKLGGVSTNYTGVSWAVGADTLTISSTSNIKLGMIVHHSGLDTNSKVIEIVNSTDIKIDKQAIAAGAAGGGGQTLAIGFTIRHISDTISTTPATRYPAIIVDNIEAACENNSEQDTYKLHKGMRLLSYNDAGVDMGDGNVIIQDIEANPNGDGYIIYLTGYYRPLFRGAAAPHGLVNAFSATNQKVVFEQVTMNGASNNTERNTWDCRHNWDTNYHGIGAVGYDMVILKPRDVHSGGEVLPQNPYVWETEPKESEGLDIYYEISDSVPLRLDKDTVKTAIPIGSMVRSNSSDGWETNVVDNVIVTDNISASGDIIITSEHACISSGGCDDGEGGLTLPLAEGSLLKITKPNGVLFGVKIVEVLPENPGDTTTNRFRVNSDLWKANYRLNWHNCYSFGNGVESNRIRDNFNLPFVLNGIKASTTITEDYQEERRKYGLIYSGIYNSTSGVNNLNQFITAEKITKDINPIYGSIQKLYAGWGQGGDLVTLCEDRILKILANKDALYNADGDSNITSTNNVLGTTIPYSGEYGISKNPESFAAESYRAYFSDKVRGSIMRLSMDGLTPVSDHGMKDWFRDNLKLSSKVVGSYDDKKGDYNVTIRRPGGSNDKTVTFDENVKGWVSFKSFTPENAISCANEYYTFKSGRLWRHHSEAPDTANNFYNNGTDQSWVSVIFNDAPGVVKSFKTLNYEGTHARVQKVTDPSTGLPVKDGEYFNLQEHKGWFVDSCNTHCEVGKASDFIEKECKWFAHLVGNDVNITPGTRDVALNTFITSDFNIQGIGTAPIASTQQNPGCMDESAINYDPEAEVEDGSCIYPIIGCMDPNADNYNPLANKQLDEGSCLYLGCTNEDSINYNPQANVDDGTCIAISVGCTDITYANYCSTCNTMCGGNYLLEADVDTLSVPQPPKYCCKSVATGCIDIAACNYNPLANTDDGSCTYPGCTDPQANNYNQTAGCNDGSCTILGCTDLAANNYDPAATLDDGSCNYDVYGCTDGTTVNIDGTIGASNYDPAATIDDGSCVYPVDCAGVANGPAVIDQCGVCDGDGTSCLGCTDPPATNYDPSATIDDGSCLYCVYGCTDPTANNYDTSATCDDGSCLYNLNGCTDPNANNYDPSATTDDGSCTYDCPDVEFNLIEDNGDQYMEISVDTTNTHSTWTPKMMFAQSDPAQISKFDSCSLASKYAYGGAFGTTHSINTPFGNNIHAQGGPSQVTGISLRTRDASFSTGCHAHPYLEIAPGTTFAPCFGITNWIAGSSHPEWKPLTGPGQSGAYIRFAVLDFIQSQDIGTSLAPTSVTFDMNINRRNGVGSNSGNPCSFGGYCHQEAKTFSIGCKDPQANNEDATADIHNSNMCTYDVLGCTDPLANNYSAGATVDDGTCTYDVYGCTDPTASNYDPSANIDDNSCIYPINGCMDPLATNYDSSVTADDGSCVYPCPSISVSVVEDAGVQFFEAVIDTTNSVAQNWSIEDALAYNSALFNSAFASGSGCGPTAALLKAPFDSSHIPLTPWNQDPAYHGTTITQWFNLNTYTWLTPVPADASTWGSTPQPTWTLLSGAGQNGYSVRIPVLDITYTNPGVYTSGAMPGTQTYPYTVVITFELRKSNVLTASKSQPCGNHICNTITETFTIGCTDNTANNYDGSVDITNNDVCTYDVPGCTDPTATNYDPSATSDDGSCTYPATVNGCTDLSACNYDASATVDDGTCTYPGCTDPNYFAYDPNAGCLDTSQPFGTICGEPIVGCTDSSACDYVPQMTTSNPGGCIYPNVSGCTLSYIHNAVQTTTNHNPYATADCSGNCLIELVTNAITGNQLPQPTPMSRRDLSCCTYMEDYGCTDELACNYDASAIYDNGSCEYTSCV